MAGKNIIIVGGGFAGTSALKRLQRHRKKLDGFNFILVDKREYSEFLPMLPDIIGGRVPSDSLRVDLKDVCRRAGSDFIKGEVSGIDPGKKLVFTGKDAIGYEYAVVSTGSETNFFGAEAMARSCFKLDNTDDGLRIHKELTVRIKSSSCVNVVVVGGGYTGIEAATNVCYLLKRSGRKFSMAIVEKSPEILMMVPEWLRRECRAELKRVGIAVFTGDSLESYDGQKAVFRSGKKTENAFCIWSAGVRTPVFLENLPGEKERTRIKVDKNLRIKGLPQNNIFLAGDNGAFAAPDAEGSLRMAVMFAMGQGKIAAENIVNSVLGKPLAEYAPVDLGYLIPFATGKAPGIIMGKRVDGRIGYLLHYLMCVYRSEPPNRVKMLKYWLKGGRCG